MNKRIAYLDGHRGLAILMVVFYHAYARWWEVVPYGTKYSDRFPIVHFGVFGVQLFFLISGFVILMTLEKCTGAREFLARRWLRLFPAMLLCSILIFATAGFFHERPSGKPTWLSLVPGLTFVDLSWWSVIPGFSASPLEVSFWSLYAEFKFYVFSALIYFWKGRKGLFLGLTMAFAATILLKVANEISPHAVLGLAGKGLRGLGFEYFGWFGAGAAFYTYSKSRELKWFVVAVGLAAISSVFVRGWHWDHMAGAAVVGAVFTVSVISTTFQRVLTLPILQFFGFISYPLYLIHENMMIAMILKMDRMHLGIPDFLYPVVAIAVLSGVTYAISRYGEGWVRNRMLELGRRLGSR